MQRKQRTCLKCDEVFDSWGPGNRICQPCQKANDRLPRFTEAQLQQQRGVKRLNGEIIDPVLDDTLFPLSTYSLLEETYDARSNRSA